ncbi:hypothetical protein, partial [Helicobacter marmotae]
NATMKNLTNNSTITTLNNYANATMDMLTNAKTISTLSNYGSITQGITNQANATITTLNNAATTLSKLENSGTIDELNLNSGSVTTLENKANATIKTLNNSGSVTTAFTNEGTIETFNNKAGGSFAAGITNSSSITTFTNSGTITGGITNSSNATLTTLNNQATLAKLDNQGTLTTLSNTSHIDEWINNKSGSSTNYSSQNTTTGANGASSNYGTIKTLTNTSGTINVQDRLVIGNANNWGTLTNNATISAQDKTIEVRGSINNTSGTITAGEIILTSNITIPHDNQTQGGVQNNQAGGVGGAQTTTTSNVHLDGTINNGTSNGATQGTKLTLNNWAIELKDSAETYNATTSVSNANSHFIVGANVNLSEITFGAREDSEGHTIDTGKGILITATDDKWGKKYEYKAMFLKQNGTSTTTLIKDIQDEEGNIKKKTDTYGTQTEQDASNLGGSTTLKIVASKHLYTAQSSVAIIDLNDGFALGLSPEGSPGEQLSEALLNGVISKNMLIGDLLDSMSRRNFHNSYAHKKGSIYKVKSKSLDTEGKRVKDNDVLVPLAYTDIEILHQVDTIFAPHAKDSSFQSFVLPFSRFTTSTLETKGEITKGTETAGGSIMGSFMDLKKWGTLGVYAGYESANSTWKRSDTGSASVKTDSFLIGGQYYKPFYTKGVNEYYLKSMPMGKPNSQT